MTRTDDSHATPVCNYKNKLCLYNSYILLIKVKVIQGTKRKRYKNNLSLYAPYKYGVLFNEW